MKLDSKPRKTWAQMHQSRSSVQPLLLCVDYCILRFPVRLERSRLFRARLSDFRFTLTLLSGLHRPSASIQRRSVDAEIVIWLQGRMLSASVRLSSGAHEILLPSSRNTFARSCFEKGFLRFEARRGLRRPHAASAASPRLADSFGSSSTLQLGRFHRYLSIDPQYRSSQCPVANPFNLLVDQRMADRYILLRN